MELLPDDFAPLVAGYLPPRDAIALGRTCKRLRSQLSLAATRKRLLLTNFSRQNRDDSHHCGFPVPVPPSCHSVAISMRWNDQGWGNLKGRVVVVANDEEGASQSSGEFGGGRVICRSSGFAPHREERLTIEFRPRIGASHHLWYGVGGGGGHSLHLEEVSVQALLFGSSDAGSFAKAHDFLLSEGISHPWDHPASSASWSHCRTLRALLESTIHLLAQGSQLPPPTIEFFGKGGIAEADLSLELIRSMQSIWKEWEAEYSVYKRLMQDHAQDRMDVMEESDDFSDFSRISDGVVEMFVEGSGTPEVNGIYRRSGMNDDVPMFSKTALYHGRYEEFSLFRCRLTDNTRRWYISIVPLGRRCGTTEDIDFFAVIPDPPGSDLPPRNNWFQARDPALRLPALAVYPRGDDSDDESA